MQLQFLYTMLIINYISYATHYLTGEHSPLDNSYIQKIEKIHSEVIHFLTLEDDFSILAKPLLTEVFELRLSFYHEMQSDIFKRYLTALMEKIADVYNFYPESRLTTITTNALDVAACIATHFTSKMEASAYIVANANKLYVEKWVQASLEMEVALMLSEECLMNEYSQATKEKVADYLKMLSELFGAYALMIGVWIPDNENLPANYENIRIVASALKLKHKYAHLAN